MQLPILTISRPEAANHHSPVHAKIALFRWLFRGRDDVYPRRFESRKTGKSGYAPACANEWVRGICEKPRIKCAQCPHRRFLPVTDEAIRCHLAGQDAAGGDFVMGVYPMLLDETCFFLAADFDKACWREDVTTFLETCRGMKLPAMLERSRSGNGGHVWLFFEEAVPAALARKLGAHILTETMERRPDIGLDSYDRFFPNQDTLPQGVKWFKDKDVYRFIGQRLSLIPAASMRWYVKAGEMHRLGADWQSWLLRAWLPEDPKLAMVAEILNDPKLQTADQRAKRFKELGGGSRATFMRKQAEWRRLRGMNDR